MVTSFPGSLAPAQGAGKQPGLWMSILVPGLTLQETGTGTKGVHPQHY